MTEKRFIYKIKNGAMVIIDKKDNVLVRDKYRACDYLNQLNNENEQLKEEKVLLKNKLDRIEDILPHYLSCAEISEFHSKTFKEDIALMKCWNKRYQK